MDTACGRTLTNVTRARVSTRSLVSIVEKRTVVRARDLYRSGIHPEALSRTLRRGLFLKIGRELYARKDFSADFERQIMLACKRVPNRIVSVVHVQALCCFSCSRRYRWLDSRTAKGNACVPSNSPHRRPLRPFRLHQKESPFNRPRKRQLDESAEPVHPGSALSFLYSSANSHR